MHGGVAQDRDVSALDVAEYILEECGPMDALKLQKLCYYAQAWSLAWGRPRMFPEAIEAWRDGPIVRELFREHKGQYTVTTVRGDSANVRRDPLRVATLTSVIGFYSSFSGRELSEMTHSERPWIVTRERERAQPGEYCDGTIHEDEMRDYYREQEEKAVAARDAARQRFGQRAQHVAADAQVVGLRVPVTA